MGLVDDIVNDILAGDSKDALPGAPLEKTAAAGGSQPDLSTPEKLADELEKVAYQGLSIEMDVTEKVLEAAAITEVLTGQNILERFIA